MEIPGLISLLKFLISIHEQILFAELIPFLESIMIPLPGKIAIQSSITIPEPIPIAESVLEPTSESDPEFNVESASESAPELILTTESESGGSDFELPPLMLNPC